MLHSDSEGAEGPAPVLLGVLELAGRFCVPWLICECEIQLGSCISLTNVCAILTAADMYRADQLRAYCLARASSFLEVLVASPDAGYEDLDQGLRDEIETWLA